MARKQKQKSYGELTIWIAGIYLVFFAINYFGKPFQMFLTDHISLSSKEDIWLLALVQTLTVIIILLAFWFSIKLAFKALQSPKRFVYFGIFFILLGGGGLLAMLISAPASVLKKNPHVIIIGAFLFLIGLFMLLKRKAKG